MSSIRNKFLCGITAGAAAAFGTIVFAAAPAQATYSGYNGLVAYTAEGRAGSTAPSPLAIVVDPKTNTSRPLLPPGMTASRGAVFSPDGSRVAYWAHDYAAASFGWRLYTSRPDGTDARRIDLGSEIYNAEPFALAWAPGGANLRFVTRGRIYSIYANGDSQAFVLQDAIPALVGRMVTNISVGADGSMLLSLQDYGAPDTERRVIRRNADGTVTDFASPATDAEFAPGGTTVILRAPATPGQSQAEWPAKVVDLQGGVVDVGLTPGTPYARMAPSPDNSTLLYTKYKKTNDYNGHCDTLAMQRLDDPEVTLGRPGDCAVEPTWQSTRVNVVNRLGGRTAVETATAASQEQWAAVGAPAGNGREQADAVVLTRNDYYGDGLVGVPLAAAKKGPLLLTDRNSLSASAETEIKRILPAGKTVYLLGDSTALFEPVAARVRALGYNAVWLGGRTQYETAIAIANATNPNPAWVLFATGREYYDALSAGPAAAANNAVVLLTDGDTLPASVYDYILAHPNAKVMGIGDPAADALKYGSPTEYYYSITGRTAIETATETAKGMFDPPPTAAGVATMRSFHDAMSGGALMARNHAPILLSDPDRLNWATQDYLRVNSASIGYVAVLGDEGALSSSVRDTIAGEIALPGMVTSTNVPAAPGARSLEAPAAPGPAAERGTTSDRSPLESLPAKPTHRG
ncbi:cell wall-binding repeat-containing protein [Embleya sp. NPDC008237]|uniref:cell wall-binding repeat-containing protein n=1 Tax=Embleya sp. NPDC008237 TaxID=3363978 RepID=UPI0036EA06CD